ncbi:MAG: type II pantothenate kinase [Oscillospiraceae bacterium]|nr:type II pantothenate kinase [Oscillospiraceae bacterium]
MSVIIGIDVGGSTTKIAGYHSTGVLIDLLRVTATDPVTSVYGALGRFLSQAQLSLQQVGHIILTGVGASHFDGDIYGIPTSRVTEFEAIGLGGLSLSGKDAAVVVSMGTGTAFVKADKNGVAHIGGSGVGGGTISGLCEKLTGVSNYEMLHQMSENGDLSNVDLSVGDISKNSIGKLNAAATASNFGKLEDNVTNADLVRGVYNMVFQTIGMLAVFACQNSTVQDVVLTGTLTASPLARQVFDMLETMYQVKFIVPEHAAFATSIGAVLSYMKQ